MTVRRVLIWVIALAVVGLLGSSMLRSWYFGPRASLRGRISAVTKSRCL